MVLCYKKNVLSLDLFKNLFNRICRNKMLILCDCLDILGDINNLRLNFYNGACGYLKLNNIDSTLKRTYSFNDDKLIITNNSNGKSFNF